MRSRVSNAVTGVVLAGGQSRRFGSDKALALFGNLSMLERSVSLLASLELNVLVVTHPSRSYEVPPARIIHDLTPDRGPLGGIFTALNHCQTSSILVLSCDMPNLTPQLISNLVEAHDPKELATVYTEPYRMHPFPGIYSRLLEDPIAERLSKGRLEMQDFLSHLFPLKKIDIENHSRFFLNVNRLEDLALRNL